MTHGVGADVCRKVLPVVVVTAVQAMAAVPMLAKEVPFLAGRVMDQADMIPSTTEERIDAELTRFERETGAQVAVLTVESLEGEVLEDYSVRVAQTWRLGREGIDDGVLLLIAEQDRKLRIEVGYGLEGELTDLEAGRIVRRVITPRFKEGDFAAGVEQGVMSILGTLRDEPGAIPAAPPPGPGGSGGFESLWERSLFGLVFVVVVGLFSVQALFGKGCQGWLLYFFLMPFYFSFPLFIFGSVPGLIIAAAWVVGFPLLKLFFRHTSPGRSLVRDSPVLGGVSTWAARSGGSGGALSGGGGFSGGGGSFGGGGASGSW